MKRALLASRIFDVPLLVERNAAEAFVSGLADDFSVEPIVSAEQLQSFARPERYPSLHEDYGGVAVVPIVGELSHRAHPMDAMSGAVGYAGLQTRMLAIADNPKTKGMILDIDTPGGEVGGLAELSAAIKDISARMPIWAVANSLAASAGYWIASSSDRLLATPYSRVGSIGVVMLHIDISKAIEKRGIVTTFIHAGKHKIDGNGLQPLTDQAKKSMIAGVNEVYEQFVDHVASSRNMKAQDVRVTEARVYGSKDALELGLVDGISTLSEAIAGMKVAIDNRRKVTVQGTSMKTYEDGLSEGKAQGIAEGRAAATTEAQSAQATAVANATKEATAKGASSERTRIKGILEHDEAKGRSGLANHLAFNTDSTVEASVDLLKVSAKEGKVAAVKGITPPTGAEGAATSILTHLRQNSPGVEAEAAGNETDEEKRRAEIRAGMQSMNSQRRPHAGVRR